MIGTPMLLMAASVAILLGFRSARMRKAAIALAVIGMLLGAARGCLPRSGTAARKGAVMAKEDKDADDQGKVPLAEVGSGLWVLADIWHDRMEWDTWSDLEDAFASGGGWHMLAVLTG